MKDIKRRMTHAVDNQTIDNFSQTWTGFIWTMGAMGSMSHMLMVSIGIHGMDITIHWNGLRWRSGAGTLKLYLELSEWMKSSDGIQCGREDDL